MEHHRAELSSIGTAVDELTARITDVARAYDDTEREDIAIRLYEVERHLRGAGRALTTAARSMN